MPGTLVDLFAKHFIARRDIKAIQHSDGTYAPTRTREGGNIGWRRADIEAHLAGQTTYGHYLLNTDDTVKVFCIDVDLRHTREQNGAKLPDGYLPKGVLGEDWSMDEPIDNFEPANVREVWSNRKDPRRAYLKYCMRDVAGRIGYRISTELEIPFAVAYSGNKGIHIYGFTGRVPAADAREGAVIALESTGLLELERGDSIYKYSGIEAADSFINFSFEVYPKQTSLAGKDLGNLLRLPLGRNQKSKDPTFFMDMTSALTDMRPVDPVFALTTDNPWKRPGE